MTLRTLIVGECAPVMFNLITTYSVLCYLVSRIKNPEFQLLTSELPQSLFLAAKISQLSKNLTHPQTNLSISSTTCYLSTLFYTLEIFDQGYPNGPPAIFFQNLATVGVTRQYNSFYYGNGGVEQRTCRFHETTCFEQEDGISITFAPRLYLPYLFET